MTVNRLAREVFDEMNDDAASIELVHEYVEKVVPTRTTELFQMVVDDNSLAFLDLEYEVDSPFQALSGALTAAIEDAVRVFWDESS